ncbi:hypothetical protein A3C26_04000 [Candidatus Daviesbacteria bacterium RIFCSPHIGHO2_02_FULL_39_12]|uniref:Uncharacterized protein n=1 Tax=Candidatus Daviesbacteria bacterium RIFCSPHIGHO2_02_FULL_39_12 TaxID=1797770 RepID=A0A1F5J9L7_9BACT|nr:MAG: hypothetical protein A3C26_04000 [Candidatus Daviesbacteria bacterium RIFCSPHIGHO2_02_FULL_39_12]
MDVSLLVKTILDKIGGNKLGEYYKKHVLNKDDLVAVSFPYRTRYPTGLDCSVQILNILNRTKS